MDTSETGTATRTEPTRDAAPDVSIVVPAFNEAGRIGLSLEKMGRFLAEHHPDAELIVVDDGSTDRTSETAASCSFERCRIVRNSRNRGKGFSVRRGFLESRGRLVLFTDADLSAPIEEMDRLLAAAEAGADVVIGSRAVDRSKIVVHQSRAREMAGILFNSFVRLVLGLPLADTQCGFKLFDRAKLAPIFEQQRTTGFGFDPEVLFLARKAGLVIREVPVEWSHDDASKVRFFEHVPRMLLDILRIRWDWLRGRYRRP